MFITAKVENPQGEVLDLMSKRGSYVVERIDGLNPPPATINTNNIYGMDGARLNSHYLGTRNIVVTMRLRGDQEASRQELYQFMDSNVPVRFYFQNRNRNVYIDGIVESIEDDMFVQTQTLMASIICPDPYFHDLIEKNVELENSQNGFEFPLSINIDEPIEFSTYEENRETEVIIDSQVEIPFEIEITTRQQLYYFTSFTIQNVLTGEKIGFAGWPNDDGFVPGDVIRISTDPYHPTMTVKIGQTVYNRVPQMILGGSFFTLHPGRNLFAYKTNPEPGDAAFLDINLRFRNRYRGV